jgi:syntaxin-binding protein 5
MPVGGPDRPISKRAALAQSMEDNPPGQRPPKAGSSKEPEGYWDYMSRQINERTEKLGNLSEGVDKLGEASSSWANEASKYVDKTKKNLIMGAVKSKFGI